ncbi:MAG: DNA gyrase C-terminal beta-propeller domain-containing protein [Phycisphaerales bacterium]
MSRWRPTSPARRQGHPRVRLKEEDFIEHSFVALDARRPALLPPPDSGYQDQGLRAARARPHQQGKRLVNYIDLRGERTCLPRDRATSSPGSPHVRLARASSSGRAQGACNVNRSGLIAVGLKEGDELDRVKLTNGNDDIILVTAAGMAIRFSETDVRLMGLRRGRQGIELGDDNTAVGPSACP